MNRLKQLRIEKKLSGTKIAEIIDISAQYYYDLEKGERRLTEDLINKFADFFEVTTDYLLARTDRKELVLTNVDGIEVQHNEGYTLTENDIEQIMNIIKKTR